MNDDTTPPPPPPQEQARQLALIDDLRALPAETTWVEFKENKHDAEMIGKLVSALSNSARLADQHYAYVVWGIRDGDHEPVGASFEPSAAKHKDQPLELWLSQHLQPAIAIEFKSLDYKGHRLILLAIPAAATSPVGFDRTAFIRIGSATPRLADHPERQKLLWSKLQPYAWESGVAAQFQSSDEVLAKLDHTSYFELTGQPLPDNREGIFDRLKADRLIEADVGGKWNITNLGAILFAKQLADFSPSIARKGVRFVAYEGNNRATKVTHRRDGQKGYACGFSGLVDYIDGLLPSNEHIGKAFREEEPLYPSIAIRELIANALIHQDMTITGAGPLVELFKDRLEITNPGEPLVSPDRFLDSPPRSRNEALASLMRRMRLCEEQETGIDKVLASAELHQLPPPDFQNVDAAVRATLFAPRRFADMTQEERVRACYQHAALKYVSGERMTNSSLRERFGIAEHNASQASAVIRMAQDEGQIRPADPDHPRAGYVPHWA
ncbi:ATP-binding protein [Pseudopontixanthobacter vadosimaris]|uniref:ATP-binding protein n=1 Tax=Pseudopontixanthobacter vadosimaris TaxID=2726450 RepID=UPI0014736B4F|nr:ATP-binding protein [Pseudopontixanthobacter vadosimaris]